MALSWSVCFRRVCACRQASPSPCLLLRDTPSPRHPAAWPARSLWSSRAVASSPARSWPPGPYAPSAGLPGNSCPETQGHTGGVGVSVPRSVSRNSIWPEVYTWANCPPQTQWLGPGNISAQWSTPRMKRLTDLHPVTQVSSSNEQVEEASDREGAPL